MQSFDFSGIGIQPICILVAKVLCLRVRRDNVTGRTSITSTRKSFNLSLLCCNYANECHDQNDVVN
jgi:hypothetical protein